MTPTPKLKFLTDPKDDNALSIKYVDIQSIKFLPDNIKAHDTEGIIQNILRYGFVDPILINTNTVHDLDGNGTLEALLLMRERRISDPKANPVPKGIVEREIPNGKVNSESTEIEKRWYVPIIDLAFSEMDELTLAISLNRLAEKGGVDASKAFSVLKRLLDNQPQEFAKTGYDQETLEHLQRLHRFQKIRESPAIAEERTSKNIADLDFAAKLNEKWKVAEGDVWSLGDHRLMCGDATIAANFTVLVPAAEHVRLVCTSPPYDNQRSYEANEKFDWTGMMTCLSIILNDFLEAPADIVINLGLQYKDSRFSFYWNQWLEESANIGLPLYGQYIWDKGFGYPGDYHGRLATSHEYLFHFSLGHVRANKWIETTGATLKRGPTNFSKRKANGTLKPGYDSPDTLAQDHKIPDSVIRLFNEQSRGIHTKGHPAVYPVALPDFLMQTWSNVGDIVYEPFAGSGTTIIAGEYIGRRVRAMEISANYCALILERISQTFPDMEIKKI